MLRKLYKHEFVSIYRILLPLYAVIVCFSAISGLLNFIESDNTFVQITQTVTTVVTGITLFGLMFACIVLVVIGFYKSLLGKQGYLTFSLPFKAIDHVICKLFCGVIAGITTGIIEVISLYALSWKYDIVPTLFDELKVFFFFGSSTQGVLKTVLVCAELIVMVILYFSTTFLMFFAAISIGQRFKNKILGSILTYIIIYGAVEFTFTFVILGLSALDWSFVSTFFTAQSYFSLFQRFFIMVLVVYLIQAIPYFVITSKFLSKKLNLE